MQLQIELSDFLNLVLKLSFLYNLLTMNQRGQKNDKVEHGVIYTPS